MSTAIVQQAPLAMPWQRQEDETLEDYVAFWAWYAGGDPYLDSELAERHQWARRATWLDTSNELPRRPEDLLAQGVSYELVAAYIAARYRASRAHEDPAWAASDPNIPSFATLAKTAAGIEIPDHTAEIDYNELFVQGRVTSEELEIIATADAIRRRIGEI